MKESERFDHAMRMFDGENACDPNVERIDGQPRPRELVYAERLSAWVRRLAPDASDALRLAARCQHLCRWMIPRADYPMDRAGYLKWRSELKRFHARKSGEILRQAGYDEPVVARVAALNLKENLARDPEAQVMEDALCLVFLEHQFTELAARTEESKMIEILRKTWGKMSEGGRQAALRLPMGARERALLAAALGTAGQ